jgi:hypothetical protein
MQNKTLYAFLFLTCLTCCKSENKKFTIEGTVPSTKYDGEWIYLVPAEGTCSSNVDSVKIANASFTFEGNKEQMSIIRTRPLLRLKLQELLLVTEPGTTKAIIDSVSSAHGTPQNDALQLWKAEKEKIMVGYMFIRKGLENVSGKDSLRWVAQKNMFIKREQINNERILKEQGHNTVGTFVRKITGEAHK